MMARCKNCNKLVIFPALKDGNDKFCSFRCYTASDTGTFCEKCLDSTIDESPGDTVRINGFGKTFLFHKDRCPVCHSLIRTKFFCILYIPILVLGRYRVIYDKNRGWQYYGRRIKNREEILAQKNRLSSIIKLLILVFIVLVSVGYFKGWHHAIIAGFQQDFGDKNKALQYYMSVWEKAPETRMIAVDIAECYALMGDKEKALYWLKNRFKFKLC